MDKKELLRPLYHKYIWYREVIHRHNKARIGLRHKLRAIRYGFSSDFYRLYELDKNPPLDYISEYRRIVSRDIVGNYKILLDDKIIFTEFFSRYVNVPEIKYLLDKGLYDGHYNRRTFDDFLADFHNTKYIVKPIKGACGNGVHIIEERDGIFIDYAPADARALEALLRACDQSIVNAFVTQHEYSARIYPGSVNTIRLITIREPDTGEVVIACAAHRFGNALTGAVDNVSRGGYVALVDIDTGTIGYARKTSSPEPVRVHPDTGAQIEGTVIPRWNEISAAILAAGQRCAYIPFIAWDIAVTDDSYVVLEANASCSLELFQMFGSIKGSKLWNFYRHYGIVK